MRGCVRRPFEDPDGILIARTTTWKGLAFKNGPFAVMALRAVHARDMIQMSRLARGFGHKGRYPTQPILGHHYPFDEMSDRPLELILKSAA